MEETHQHSHFYIESNVPVRKSAATRRPMLSIPSRDADWEFHHEDTVGRAQYNSLDFNLRHDSHGSNTFGSDGIAIAK